jgi:hypothetical protein
MRCAETLDFTTDAPCPNEAEYTFHTPVAGWHDKPTAICGSHAHIFEAMMRRHMPGIQFTLTRLTEKQCEETGR